jgi:hypothetical protein
LAIAHGLASAGADIIINGRDGKNLRRWPARYSSTGLEFMLLPLM